MTSGLKGLVGPTVVGTALDFVVVPAFAVVEIVGVVVVIVGVGGAYVNEAPSFVLAGAVVVLEANVVVVLDFVLADSYVDVVAGVVADATARVEVGAAVEIASSETVAGRACRRLVEDSSYEIEVRDVAFVVAVEVAAVVREV